MADRSSMLHPVLRRLVEACGDLLMRLALALGRLSASLDDGSSFRAGRQWATFTTAPC